MKFLNLFFALIYSLPLICQTNCQIWQLGNDIYGDNSEGSVNVVSINDDGSIVAVGSFHAYVDAQYVGKVSIYQNNNGLLTQLGADINGGAQLETFGYSISINGDGNRVAIGAPGSTGTSGTPSLIGYVKVYEFDGYNWAQIGETIVGSEIGCKKGYSVSLNSEGNILAVGEPNSTNISANVVLYNYSIGSWNQLGDPIIGFNFEAPIPSFEASYPNIEVELNDIGDIVAIGSSRSLNNNNVYVFIYDGNFWLPMGSPVSGNISNTTEIDHYGNSISLSSDGKTMAIGGWVSDSVDGGTLGYVKTFEFQEGEWIQVSIDIVGDSQHGYFGYSVSLNDQGDVLAVSSPESPWNNVATGYVRLFERVGGDWIQLADDFHCGLGFSLNIVDLNSDGTILAFSLTNTTDFSNYSGYVKVFENLCIFSGCTDAQACNFDNNASIDNNSCWYVGQSCDDSDDLTLNDVIQEDCTCSGVVGVQDIGVVAKLVISPNPVIDQIIISSFTENAGWRIFNMFGKQIMMGNGQIIDVSTLSEGQYVLTDESGQSTYFTKLE